MMASGHREHMWFVFLTVGLFCMLSAVVYGMDLPRTFVTLNDSELVYSNPIVQSITPGNIFAAFSRYDPELYIPFTFLSYQVDWWLGGGSAYVFHLTNLILHTINALIVCLLVTLLSRNRWVGVFCGLVFLLHPINTETVLWISARKDLLSSFFGRLTILTYAYYVIRHRRRFLYISIALFLCALLSKVKVIHIPLILLLIDWKEGRAWTKTVLMEKVPHLALSVVFGIIAFFGKDELLASSNFATKLILSVLSTVFYIYRIVVPKDFSIYYPFLHPVSLLSTHFLIPFALLLGASIVVWRSRRWTKEILFGCMMYLIGILASFTNLAKGSDLFVGSDRYVYTASIGITYAIAMGVLLLLRFYPKTWLRNAAIAASAVIVIGLGVLSYEHAKIWHNSVTLYEDAIAKNPDYYRAHYDLGVGLDAAGHPQEAIAAYEEALRLAPSFSVAHLNLGRDLYLLGRKDDARMHFQHALDYNPHFPMAMFNLGVLAAEEGKTEEATRYYESAVAEYPEFVDAWINLAATEADQGDFERATQHLARALTIDPENEKTIALVAEFMRKGIVQPVQQ